MHGQSAKILFPFLGKSALTPCRSKLNFPAFSSPTFPSTCLAPDQPGYGQISSHSGRRKSRRTANPNFVLGTATHAQDNPKHPQPTASAGPSARYQPQSSFAYDGVAPADVPAAPIRRNLPYYVPNVQNDYQIPAGTQTSHLHIPHAADVHSRAPSGAYIHTYSQTQNRLVPQTQNEPRDQVQNHSHIQSHAQSVLGSGYPLLPPLQLTQGYRNTPSYPQQSEPKKDRGTRQEHHRQQLYSPYPSPSQIYTHGHSHCPAPKAAPIENTASDTPRTPHTSFISHPSPYRTRDREHDSPIHLPPLSSLGPPLLPLPRIQSTFGGGLPSDILGSSGVNNKVQNGPINSTYTLPPISSLDYPGTGTGPDGSSAVLRRLRLDDEHVHAHRRDLDARAAALHRTTHSESGFILPSPRELRRRRSISAPPLKAYGGGWVSFLSLLIDPLFINCQLFYTSGSSTGNPLLPISVHDNSWPRDVESERDGISSSQSRGLQHSPRHDDPGPPIFAYPKPYTSISGAPYDHYASEYEQPQSKSASQPPHYLHPLLRSPALSVYHGTETPRWPTPFPPPNTGSGSGSGPSYMNEMTARASGSSTHHTQESWAHSPVSVDDVERKAAPPTRMPSRPW